MLKKSLFTLLILLSSHLFADECKYQAYTKMLVGGKEFVSCIPDKEYENFLKTFQNEAYCPTGSKTCSITCENYFDARKKGDEVSFLDDGSMYSCVFIEALQKAIKPKYDLIGEFSFYEMSKIPPLFNGAMTEDQYLINKKATENNESSAISNELIKNKYKIEVGWPNAPRNGSYWQAIAKSDFDNDGYADVLISNNGNYFLLSKTNSDAKVYNFTNNYVRCVNKGNGMICVDINYKWWFENY